MFYIWITDPNLISLLSACYNWDKMMEPKMEALGRVVVDEYIKELKKKNNEKRV